MYLQQELTHNLRVATKNSRGADSAQFHVEMYLNCKYKNSSFYKGAELWKSLPLEVATSDTLSFQKALKKGIEPMWAFDTIYF